MALREGLGGRSGDRIGIEGLRGGMPRMVLIVRGLIDPSCDDFRRMVKRDVLKAFGDRVREIRALKGLSQEELARQAKIDRTYIGGIERGERNAGIKNVWRIADALGVPAADLFREGGGRG